MKYLILTICSLLSVPAFSDIPDYGSDGEIFSRVYSEEHMKKNPNQSVKSVDLQFGLNDSLESIGAEVSAVGSIKLKNGIQLDVSLVCAIYGKNAKLVCKPSDAELRKLDGFDIVMTVVDKGNSSRILTMELPPKMSFQISNNSKRMEIGFASELKNTGDDRFVLVSKYRP